MMTDRGFGRRDLLRAGLALPFGFRASLGAGPKSFLVYWGTYTEGGGQFGNGESKGIYVSRMDAATGKLTAPELAAESPNPSWLTIHPNRRYLYAVNERLESGSKVGPGEVSAFLIDAKTGRLTNLNRVPSRGGQPCHICTDKSGRMAMVANWYTGSTAAFPIGRHGELGESTAFSQHGGPRSGEASRGQPAPGQPGPVETPHCHSVVVTPDNRFLLSTDTDMNKVYVYRLDPAKATFAPHDPPFLGLRKPTNPRHLALHPNGRLAYVANEISPGGCTLLRFDAARGVLEEGPVAVSVPPEYKGRTSAAECVVHPSGRFVYESNRGHNSIAVFRVASGDGALTLVEAFVPGGETPRSFSIDPTGKFLIAMMQRSGTIVPLRIDRETGKLTPNGDPLKLPLPVCAEFLGV
jgi:6-phosphogluconolactonase